MAVHDCKHRSARLVHATFVDVPKTVAIGKHRTPSQSRPEPSATPGPTWWQGTSCSSAPRQVHKARRPRSACGQGRRATANRPIRDTGQSARDQASPGLPGISPTERVRQIQPLARYARPHVFPGSLGLWLELGPRWMQARAWTEHATPVAW